MSLTLRRAPISEPSPLAVHILQSVLLHLVYDPVDRSLEARCSAEPLPNLSVMRASLFHAELSANAVEIHPIGRRARTCRRSGSAQVTGEANAMRGNNENEAIFGCSIWI